MISPMTVCLLTGESKDLPEPHQIFTKFYGTVGHNTGTNRVDFK